MCSPNASLIIRVYKIEHARFVSQLRRVVEKRFSEDSRVTLSSLEMACQEPPIAILPMNEIDNPEQ